MSESSELVAIFKLEFYKKKKNWVIGANEDTGKRSKGKRNVLNKTYTLETNLTGAPSLNDAFLESASNLPPDDTPEQPDPQEHNLTKDNQKTVLQTYFNNNCSDPGKYPNLNLTHSLESSRMKSEDNLSKASLALMKLQNILRETENDFLNKNCTLDVESHLYLGQSCPMFHFIGQNEEQPVSNMSEHHLQGWPRQSPVWINAAFPDGNEQEVFPTEPAPPSCDGIPVYAPPPSKDIPDTSKPLYQFHQSPPKLLSEAISEPLVMKHQLFSNHHPENDVYRRRESIDNKELLKQHLDRLRMEECYRLDQGDANVVTLPEVPEASRVQKEDCFESSLQSVDSEGFMAGVRKAPHSSEIELAESAVFKIPRTTYPLHRPSSQHQISTDKPTINRSPSFDECPTKDVGLSPFQDPFLAGSFKDVAEFDMYYVGRGRGRLPRGGRPGVAWRV